jgi:hypothetical protein
MTVWGRTSTPKKTATYFDITLLKEDTCRGAFLEAWKGTQPPPSQDADWLRWLEVATERVLNCNGKLTKERKWEKGARTRGLQQKTRLAKIRLQEDPKDESIRSILSTAQGHMANSLREQVARNHQLSASTWFRYGDTCSKRFFDFHHIGRKRTLLKELSTEEGEIKGQEDLAHYVQSFYTCLYTSEASAPGTSEARGKCWASTPS